MTDTEIEDMAMRLVLGGGVTPTFAVDVIAAACPCPTDNCGHNRNQRPFAVREAMIARIEATLQHGD